MLPDIIKSMKDSPEEMNRKRYQMFVDQAAELAACQNELEAISRVLGLTGAESRPMDLYVQALKQRLAEMTLRRNETIAMCEQLRQELLARPAGTSNSHLYPKDNYGF